MKITQYGENLFWTASASSTKPEFDKQAESSTHEESFVDFSQLPLDKIVTLEDIGEGSHWYPFDEEEFADFLQLPLDKIDSLEDIGEGSHWYPFDDAINAPTFSAQKLEWGNLAHGFSNLSGPALDASDHRTARNLGRGYKTCGIGETGMNVFILFGVSIYVVVVVCNMIWQKIRKSSAS